MKHLYLLPIYLLFISSLHAQIGIHGDVTLKDNSTAGFFGPLSLVDGIVESETDASATVYLSSDFSWDTANHNSYIGTRAYVENHSEFIFPIGDGGTFHPLAIHNATQSEVTAWYQNIAHTNNTFAPNIESKANFFWKVEASAPVRLSLTWGPESALSQLTNALEALIFLGFNGNRWEIIPAQARAQDLLNQEASSISLGTMTSDESVDLSNTVIIADGEGNQRIYVDNQGNMGIGTTTPTETLSVNGSAQITGNMEVNGSITKAGTAYSHPDYVFEKYFDNKSEYNTEYRILSLSELEAFMKTNKHLPGVQSPAEIEEKGHWNVTENVRTNLEKVEELFLHTLEQEKKIEAQAKEIPQQRALQETQALEIQNLKEAMNLLLSKEKK